MKVLQINKFLYPKGGAETYMFQLSKTLKENGIDIEFWGMEDEKNIVADTYQSFAKNISYQEKSLFKIVSNTPRTIYSFDNKKRISKLLDAFQPDLIHLHNYNFQLTPSILPEIKKRGVKIVQTIHDAQMVCPYHRLYNFQKNTICTKCVTGSFLNCINDKCFDGSFFKSVIGASESYYYHTFKYYEKYIDRFISPSRFLSNLTKKRIRNLAIDIIPNFTEIIEGINTNKDNYYLYFGRISNEKGVLELVDIFKELKLNLIIIGSGDQEDELKNKIEGVKNISFLGSKSEKELFSFVTNAKYVVQPSKWYENCPMTVIESFTYNTPVIASNHSGFKDLIQHKKTGFLLDFTNLKKAKKSITDIDKEDVNILKQNINTFYQKKLKKEIHISRVIEIYKQLLQK